MAVIRSREISLTLFYQAMSQCKALYKDHSETIMGNMDSIVFLGGREASTLKDISENWLGKATISMQTEGRSRGQSESYSQNMQRLGRELMTTSEITTMPGDKCILQLRGLPPFLSPKYDLKKHSNYKYTAEFDKKPPTSAALRVIMARSYTNSSLSRSSKFNRSASSSVSEPSTSYTVYSSSGFSLNGRWRNRLSKWKAFFFLSNSAVYL